MLRGGQEWEDWIEQREVIDGLDKSSLDGTEVGEPDWGEEGFKRQQEAAGMVKTLWRWMVEMVHSTVKIPNGSSPYI